jgi:hypothetical protein
VYVPSIKHDTMFHDTTLYDTVEIEKDRLSIRMWKVLDTVFVEGECMEDTIFIDRKIPVVTGYYKDDYKWWHSIPWWVYLLVMFITGYFVYNRFYK